MTKPTIASLQVEIERLQIDLQAERAKSYDLHQKALAEQVTAGKAVADAKLLRENNQSLREDVARLGGMIDAWREVGMIQSVVKTEEHVGDFGSFDTPRGHARPWR